MDIQPLIAAFTAGLISFFAPCLLPLLPTYFSVISGFTFSDLYGLDFAKIRRRVFVSSLFFSLGFSLVFTILGATGSIIGQVLDTYLPFLLRASGIFLILLGLVQMGVLPLYGPKFDFAWKIQKRLTHLGFITAVTTGLASALSWIPCVGPLLAPILLLAGQSETIGIGVLLLFIYSLGLTLPFIVVGLFFPTLTKKLERHREMFHKLSIFAGVFIILFGVVLVSGYYQNVVAIFNSFIYALQMPLYEFFFRPPSQ